MEQFLAITGRNLKLYFKDKGAVFFSLLSMLIVIVLMMCFLGDMNVESITDILSRFPDRNAQADSKNAELLVLSWTCAGIISINAVTVTMSVYSCMIKDKVSGKLNAIYTSSLTRITITAGYIVAAWVASVCVCLLTLLITEMYGIFKGLCAFSFMEHIQLLGMILVNSFTYAAWLYVLAMLIKTEGAWSGIGTVVGTLVGFLGGIYIPIGALSLGVENLMKCMPVIYGTSMFRNIMTKEILNTTFAGLPSEIAEEYCEVMGIHLSIAGRKLAGFEEWLLLLGCGIIGLVAGTVILNYTKKTDR